MAGSSFAISVAKKEGIPLDSLPKWSEIIDCEKRRGVSRYYAYVIEVTRVNETKYCIYRRYRQFNKMCTRLEERFPIEAGSIRASDRKLPTLPGKVYIGRSAVRDVVDRRLPLLNDFMKKLFLLPDNIRYDSIVLGFLKPKPEDLSNPYSGRVAYPSGFTASVSPTPVQTKPLPPRPQPPRGIPQHSSSNRPEKPPLPLAFHPKNAHPPLPTKPAALTKPSLPPPPFRAAPLLATKGPRAKVRYDYAARYSDELDLVAGSTVLLVRQVDGGWYEGKLNGKMGLVPSNYLDIVEPLPNYVDEDESSEDEWEDDIGKIPCYYKGRKLTIDVDIELTKRPVFHKLHLAAKSQLNDPKIVLNYRDPSGDLIEIVDDSDLELMMSSSRSKAYRKPVQPLIADWSLHITKTGDHSVYNTDPYKPLPKVVVQTYN